MTRPLDAPAPGPRVTAGRTGGPVIRVLLLGLLAGLLGGLVGTAPPASAAPPDRAPLAVTLDRLSPSVMPGRGEPVVLSGEVHNRSRETWTDLQVYLVVSSSPMTTTTEIAEAAATPEDAEIGDRVTDQGLFVEVGDLDPGESTSYTLSVPRGALEISGEQGVYWLGVHVLGAVDGIRDLVADGRARSFLPLVNRRTAPVELALVLPLRDRVRRDPSGRLLATDHWQRLVSPDGRLDRLADLAATSGGPLTWVVDPAVLDAVGSVAQGDPGFYTGDDGSGPPEPGEEPSESPTGSPSGPGEGPTASGAPGTASGSPAASPTTDAPDAEGSEDEADPPSVAAQDAAAWLERLAEVVGADPVWAVPYGDLDVPAVAGNRLHRLVRRARTLSLTAAAEHGLEATPAVAPPSGFLTGQALGTLRGQDPVLLLDTAYPELPGPVLSRPDGTPVVLADTATAAGGPGPNARTSPLALRQRILAEAAVRTLVGETEPLVVSLPPRWNPGETWEEAGFFAGLAVPWLRQTDLDSLTGRGPGTPVSGPPVYPDDERSAHVPFANQLATAALVDVGATWADLLTRNDVVGAQVAEAAMLASSYAARTRPLAAERRARETTEAIRRELRRVRLEGPPFVVMSSDTGPISVTLTNDTDQPVTVRVEAITRDGGLEVSTPDPVTLDAGQRAPLRLQAASAGIGVHSVTVRAVTESGRPVGSEIVFNVRTSNVGFVVWLVMGGGAAVLLSMITLRLRRRFRAHRAARAEPAS